MQPVNLLEKHVVTLLTGIITALLVWIGLTTQSTSIGIAELRVEVRGISTNSQRIANLESRIYQLERQ